MKELSNELANLFICRPQYLKVVGNEKGGGLGVCILIEKGTGPW